MTPLAGLTQLFQLLFDEDKIADVIPLAGQTQRIDLWRKEFVSRLDDYRSGYPSRSVLAELVRCDRDVRKLAGPVEPSSVER